MSIKHQPYHNLVVWQVAQEFVKEVYLITKKFPSFEMFGITSQLRRAAVSIAANLVEGQDRSSIKDCLRFCFISLGSLRESNYFIELSYDLGYLKKEEMEKLINLSSRTGYLLAQYMASKGRSQNKNLSSPIHQAPSHPSIP